MSWRRLYAHPALKLGMPRPFESLRVAPSIVEGRANVEWHPVSGRTVSYVRVEGHTQQLYKWIIRIWPKR
jgi:hypothetical protein